MYDKFPYIRVSDDETDCRLGWSEIAAAIRGRISGRKLTVCIECYPGTFVPSLADSLSAEISADYVVLAESCYLPPEEIESKFKDVMTDDRVFGRMNLAKLEDFFDTAKLLEARNRLNRDGLHLVLGVGATVVAPQRDILIYSDLARWEIQQRYRRNEIGNVGLANRYVKASLKYKRGFFLDWPAADRLKKELLPQIDFLLDCNDPRSPKMISGADLHKAFDIAVHHLRFTTRRLSSYLLPLGAIRSGLRILWNLQNSQLSKLLFVQNFRTDVASPIRRFSGPASSISDLAHSRQYGWPLSRGDGESCYCGYVVAGSLSGSTDRAARPDNTSANPACVRYSVAEIRHAREWSTLRQGASRLLPRCPWGKFAAASSSARIGDACHTSVRSVSNILKVGRASMLMMIGTGDDQVRLT